MTFGSAEEIDLLGDKGPPAERRDTIGQKPKRKSSVGSGEHVRT